MTIFMAMENAFIKMEINMKDNLIITNDMVKEKWFILMVLFIPDNGEMISIFYNE